ncbi:MAG: hypothetical protein ACD_3C00195G0003 [uncultured bacterium (gcode 4)]|uniref:Uncharacterized protein n=1 Tax=uncultured bacterium (gcode 4) TaxID=1234023 RepID=K2GBH8_9BACT|nr:MAG: hypothetical protein ACD_3C00195G0003 [uncultured bacterium (gcode 4)]
MLNYTWLSESPSTQKLSIPQLLLTHTPTKTNEILHTSNSAISDTFTVTWTKEFKAKNPENSTVMKWHLRHLPLVPWVVQKWLLFKAFKISEDIYSWKEIIKTTFWSPILWWDEIKLSQSEFELLHADNKIAVKIEKADSCPGYEDMGYRIDFQDAMSDSDLDRILLQHLEFRFVSWLAFLKKSADSEVNIWDVFQWYFAIPEDFKFFTEDNWIKTVEPFLIEEFAAQIWVVAISWRIWHATNENNDILDTWSTMTFDSSICKYSGKKLVLGSDFRLTWRVKDITKRTVSFEYTWFNDKMEEVIRWEISGKIVGLKMLKRMTR